MWKEVFLASKASNYINYSENLVSTWQKTHGVLVTETNQLMLFKEVFVVYCEDQMKCINTSGKSWSGGQV
jgi:hypothetical protein